MIVLLIIAALSWASVPGGAENAPQPKRPECAGMKCVKGCCPDMACCDPTRETQTPPAQAPAPHRADLQFAVLATRVLSPLYLLPAPRPRFVTDEVAGSHALPPLAVSCVWLI